MGGLRCWNSPYGTYPWNLFVSATPAAPAGAVVIPIEVRQRIPGTDKDTVVNLNLQVNVLPDGTGAGPDAGAGAGWQYWHIRH